MERIKMHRFAFLSGVGGALMGIAFLHPFFFWSGIVGLAIAFYALTSAKNRTHAFWYGTIAGTIKMLIVFSSLWAVYPLDWLGDFDRSLQILGVCAVWVASSIAIGSSLGCFAWCTHNTFHHAFKYILIPSVYVLSEVLGSLFFSILMLGPQSGLNIHMSFGYIGYTLAEHGILGLGALILGVYALSFIACIGALFLLRMREKHHHHAFVYSRMILIDLSIILMCIGTYFIQIHTPSLEKGVTVTAVNTYFPHPLVLSVGDKAERVRTLIDAFALALQSGSDVVVFPEGANALGVFDTPEDIYTYIRTKTDRDAIVIDSEQVSDTKGNLIIRGNVYDTKTKSVLYLYKNYLVPTGEFLPYSVSGVISLAGYADTRELLDTRLMFVQGKEENVVVPNSIPGILFCSESLSPFVARRASRDGAVPFIVHPVSHAWFHTPKSMWHQLDLMLRTQVRFAGVPLVQAGNMSTEFAYDAYGNEITGKIIYESPLVRMVSYSL